VKLVGLMVDKKVAMMVEGSDEMMDDMMVALKVKL
jgi:hypothetical protein